MSAMKRPVLPHAGILDYEGAMMLRKQFRDTENALMAPLDGTRMEGACAESCRAAGVAIFEALNRLANYLGDEKAAQALRLARRV